MKKKSQLEIIEILLKNTINMHEKVNIILDILSMEQELEIKKPKLPSDALVKIDKNTYEQMCDLMEENVIPFMGIA